MRARVGRSIGYVAITRETRNKNQRDTHTHTFSFPAWGETQSKCQRSGGNGKKEIPHESGVCVCARAYVCVRGVHLRSFERVYYRATFALLPAPLKYHSRDEKRLTRCFFGLLEMPFCRENYITLGPILRRKGIRDTQETKETPPHTWILRIHD